MKQIMALSSFTRAALCGASCLMIAAASATSVAQDRDTALDPMAGGDTRALDDGLVLSDGDLLIIREPLGWTQFVAPPPEDAPQSELARLSRSASGIDFGMDVYDSRADNPLMPVSVTLRALDKVTASYRDITIPIGEQASFGTLTLVPYTCDKRPPEEPPETTVFLQVFSTERDVQGARIRLARGTQDQLPQPGDDLRAARDREAVSRPSPMAARSQGLEVDEPQQDALMDPEGAPVMPRIGFADGDMLEDDAPIFSGWMFASTPSLNALEHPVYDVWVIGCDMVDPGTELAEAETE